MIHVSRSHGEDPAPYGRIRTGCPHQTRAAPGRDVEDLYPLTAMQSGMLYHSLADARRGLYL
ncbi:hypothetical protein, partial [Streptomyces diastaticus]|uniref:hypothetical protein n=1 Tax=Streptomyces diastaticus TaxID=1956 RepID=UPI003655A238